MEKHNMNFTTKWELINPEGKIVDKGGDCSEATCEGKMGFEVYNHRGELKYDYEQPMHSFTIGFLKAFVDGYRLAKRNETFNVLPNLLGKSTSPTYVQQIALINPFNTYSTSNWTTSSLDSTQSGFVLDSLTTDSDCVRVVLHVERNINSGSGNIAETALYSTEYTPVNNSDDVREGMICRDSFSTPYSFGFGDFVKIIWTLEFPSTSNKTITLNWVKNFIQNIVDTDYTDFTKLDGTTATGIGSSSDVIISFTKEGNTRGSANDDTMGIVIGTSNAVCSSSDYCMGKTSANDSQIHNGTSAGQMEYGAMAQTDDIALIYPTQGKANVSYARSFKNNSGSSITVKEAGLVAKTSNQTEGVQSEGSYLIARWLTQDIVVPDEYTLKIYFQPQITATAEDHSIVNTDEIIIVPHEVRMSYRNLRNISMIQRTAQKDQNWVAAINYAQTLSYGNFNDWRLPTQSVTGNYNDKELLNQMFAIKSIMNNNLIPSIPSWEDIAFANNQKTATSVFSQRLAYGAAVESSKSSISNINFFCVR